MSRNIEHNCQANRFEVNIDGFIGHLEYNEKSEKVLDFTRTIVPKELGGRGIGTSLVERAIDYASKHTLQSHTLVLVCGGHTLVSMRIVKNYSHEIQSSYFEDRYDSESLRQAVRTYHYLIF